MSGNQYRCDVVFYRDGKDATVENINFYESMAAAIDDISYCDDDADLLADCYLITETQSQRIVATGCFIQNPNQSYSIAWTILDEREIVVRDLISG